MTTSSILALGAGAIAATLVVAPRMPSDSPAEFYPMQVGNRWTYESSIRGRFVNEVVSRDASGGMTTYRIASTDSRGRVQTIIVRFVDGKVYQGAEGGPEVLLLDLGVEAGGTFAAAESPRRVEVTYRGFHETHDVLGTVYRDVREYFHDVPGGMSSTSYFARGVGLVGIIASQFNTRLVEAELAGR